MECPVCILLLFVFSHALLPQDTRLVSFTVLHKTTITARPAAFGIELKGKVEIRGQLVRALPTQACNDIDNRVEITGKIVIMDRGGCTFVNKSRLIESLGAKGGIVVDQNSELPYMSGKADDINIPMVLLYLNEAQNLYQAMEEYPELEVVLSDKKDQSGRLVVSFTVTKKTILKAGPAHFGMDLKGRVGIRGQLVQASPKKACDKQDNTVEITGKIVIMDRGGCNFADKARIIESLGATGGIVVNHQRKLRYMGGDGRDDVNIPMVIIYPSDAQKLYQAMNDDLSLEVILSDYDDQTFPLAEATTMTSNSTAPYTAEGVPSVDTGTWPWWWPYAVIGSALLVAFVLVVVVIHCMRKNKTTLDDGTGLDNIPDQSGCRGSTHDSENSLYGVVLPTENTQRHGSLHCSENSLYGTALQQ